MSASNPPSAEATADKPPLSERDASFHVAVAGIDAREAAAASGAPPQAVRALVAAARAQDLSPIARPGSRQLRGQVLRGDDLLVSLCFMLYQRAFGTDPRHILAGLQEVRSVQGQVFQHRSDSASPEKLAAIASLAFLYAQTDEAWDLLDRAADPEATDDVREGWKRDFRRCALDFAGNFTAADIELVGTHVIDLARLAAGETFTEDGPGNAPPPVTA